MERGDWDEVFMFNSRLLTPKAAQLQFDVMGHLIQKYGLPQAPTPPVESYKSKGFEALAWTDADMRSVYDWAQDNFGAITAQNHMTDTPLYLVANDGELDINQSAAQHRLNRFTTGENPYHQPVGSSIFYDPRDSSEPGHFYASTTFQLAELRAADYHSNTNLSPLDRRKVTLITASFNSQGFTLAHLPRQLSAYLTDDKDRRAASHKIAANTLCFSTCLVLCLHGYTEAHIMRHYSRVMSRSMRKRMSRAYSQLNASPEKIDALQRLSLPKQPNDLRAKMATRMS